MSKIIDTIKELIEGAFVGQAIIASLVVATSCLLVGKGQMVPEWFVGLTATIVVWYFREQTTARQYRQELKRQSAGLKSPDVLAQK